MASEMAVDADRLYVLNNGRRLNMAPGPKLTVLDRSTLQVFGTVPIESNGVGVAASTSQHVIYVQTQYDDAQVIDSRSFEVLRKIPVNDQPKGVVAVDERTGSAYLGGAGSSTLKLSGPPRVALEKRESRALTVNPSIAKEARLER